MAMTMTSMMTLLHRSLRPMMWDYRPAGSSFHRDGLVCLRSAVCAGLRNIFQVNAEYWRRYCLSALCSLCWTQKYPSSKCRIMSVSALQFLLVFEISFRWMQNIGADIVRPCSTVCAHLRNIWEKSIDTELLDQARNLKYEKCSSTYIWWLSGRWDGGTIFFLVGSCVNEGLCDLLISTKLVYCLLVVGNPNTLIPSYQPHITDHFSAKMMLTGLTKTILHTLKETFSISRVFFFISEDIHHHQSITNH